MEENNWWSNFLNRISFKTTPEVYQPIELKEEFVNPPKKVVDNIVYPNSRTSIPDLGIGNATIIGSLNASLQRIEAEFFEVIPLIRKLSRVNSDMGQALNDIVQLANTGFKINFDPSVKPEIVDLMRKDIEDSAKNWKIGSAGLHGLVNKMFYQLMIGGAISNEWVPSKNLKNGIRTVNFLYPEKTRFVYDKSKDDYLAYQLAPNTFLRNNNGGQGDLIKLNPNTFRYFGLNGDEDVPYGIPPYWSALDPIATQQQMLDNIKFVSAMLGILGYADVTMTKPDQEEDESEADYIKRLEATLDNLVDRVKKGYKSGINVGFKDDHTFDFKSASKDVSGAQNLFQLNEQLVASGLKFDSAFLGRSYGGSDSLITILFTKMLAQLANMQEVAKYNLEFGLGLHLKLRGFNFDYLWVEFNKSTITDELKYQQAQEYKIKNLATLYADGIIDQYQYADAMGYKKPSQEEPRLPLEQRSGNSPSLDEQARADQKDASDRKQRDKAKPQGSKNTPTKTRP